MELHFVHTENETTSNEFLVVTVFFNIGEESAFLKEVKYATVSSTTDASVEITNSINAYDLIKKANDQGYISYVGSFTTPPCTEGVNFILLREWQTMSKTQWDAFANSLQGTGLSTQTYASGNGNYRTAQSVNSRTIFVNDGKIDNGDDLSDAQVAGIVILCVVGFILLVSLPVLSVIYCSRKKKTIERKTVGDAIHKHIEKNQKEYQSLDVEGNGQKITA